VHSLLVPLQGLARRAQPLLCHDQSCQMKRLHQAMTRLIHHYLAVRRTERSCFTARMMGVRAQTRRPVRRPVSALCQLAHLHQSCRSLLPSSSVGPMVWACLGTRVVNQQRSGCSRWGPRYMMKRRFGCLSSCQQTFWICGRAPPLRLARALNKSTQSHQGGLP